MQIPFEVDPPEKVEKRDEKSETLSPQEQESPQSQLEFLSKQKKKPLTVTQLTRQITLPLEGKFQ
mgnify:CR=1 FL=1